jgi:carbonic anhydrase/acetyltransferase-like protein (isoleucine patch superfamily)
MSTAVQRGVESAFSERHYGLELLREIPSPVFWETVDDGQATGDFFSGYNFDDVKQALDATSYSVDKETLYGLIGQYTEQGQTVDVVDNTAIIPLIHNTFKENINQDLRTSADVQFNTVNTSAVKSIASTNGVANSEIDLTSGVDIKTGGVSAIKVTPATESEPRKIEIGNTDDNVLIKGTTTTVNATNLEVSDNIIELHKHTSSTSQLTTGGRIGIDFKDTVQGVAGQTVSQLVLEKTADSVQFVTDHRFSAPSIAATSAVTSKRVEIGGSVTDTAQQRFEFKYDHTATDDNAKFGGSVTVTNAIIPRLAVSDGSDCSREHVLQLQDEKEAKVVYTGISVTYDSFAAFVRVADGKSIDIDGHSIVTSGSSDIVAGLATFVVPADKWTHVAAVGADLYIDGVKIATAASVLASRAITSLPLSSLDGHVSDLGLYQSLSENEIEARAASLFVKGSTFFDGSATVTGDVEIQADLDVKSNATVDGTLQATKHASGYRLDVQPTLVTVDSNIEIKGDTHSIGELHAKQYASGYRLDVTDAKVAVNTALDVTGNASVSGNVTVVGDATIQNNLIVPNNLSTLHSLQVSNASTLQDTLTVTGATDLSSTLTVQGVTELKDNLLIGSVADPSTVVINGTATISDQLTAATAQISGDTTASSNLSVGVSGSILTADASSIELKQPTTVSNALTVTGTASLAANAGGHTLIATDSSVTVSQPATMQSTLDVEGAATMQSTLDVQGAATMQSTLDVVGAATMQSTLDVVGASTLQSTLDVVGASTLQSTLDVVGTSEFKSAVTVTGELSLQDKVNVVSSGLVLSPQDSTELTLRTPTVDEFMGDLSDGQTVGVLATKNQLDAAVEGVNADQSDLQALQHNHQAQLVDSLTTMASALDSMRRYMQGLITQADIAAAMHNAADSINVTLAALVS